MKFILGRKLGMTTIYDSELGALNVTLIECEPNSVNLIRSDEKDGYKAVQIGLKKSPPRADQPRDGKVKEFDRVKEFRTEAGDLKAGDNLDISQFEIGDKVKISGITKAKGFQGVMKRHGFKGSPHSHGHKHDWRAPGSIGAGFPEHVIKGKRMAGRMGGKRASSKNIKVVFIDKDKNLLAVMGSVPGVVGRMVEILSL
jgi:large subunit ribosomal protein L3